MTPFVTFLLVLIIVLGLYGIFILILYRYDKYTSGSSATVNSLKVIARFLVIFIIAMAIFTIFDISSSALWSISSVSAIIIGFASTEVMSQIVSGFYLITTNPFDIEDLIQIGDVEGVVESISLNYTTIRQFNGSLVKIPNKKMIDITFINYTLDTREIQRQHRGIQNKPEHLTNINVSNEENDNGVFSKQAFLKFIVDMADLLKDPKITQYTFTIEIELSYDSTEIINKLQKICKFYKPIYDFQPKFAIIDMGFRAKVKFWIFCHNPYLILENHNNFISEIAEIIYSPKEAEEKL